MKKVYHFPLALACSVLFCGSLQAQIILQDTFTDANGTALASHTPNVNTTGRTYQTPAANGQPTSTISGNTATASASSVNLLFIAGNNNTPAAPTGNVTLSLDIKIGTLTGTGQQRGIFLGFYSPNGDVNPDSGTYDGIVVSPTGSLLERVQNTYTLLGTAPTGFSINNFVTLTYSLNMTSGVISSVTFGGQAYTPAAVNIFAAAAPNTVGFYSAGDAAGTQGFVDNLVYQNGIVAPAPEPSTWAMMLGGLTLLGGVQRLRRTRRA